MKNQLLTTYVIVLCLLQVLPSAASDRDDNWVECVQRTSDTQQILERVHVGLDGIPAQLKKSLREAGYKIVVTSTMSAVKKDGYERRSDYDVSSQENIAGQFWGSEHTIYIPERCSWGNSPPRLQGKGIIHVMRHEFGHAYDCYLGYASLRPAFTAAFEGDSSRLTNSERREFSYYAMQDPRSGAIELFAELFAVLCSADDKSLRADDQNIYQAFPECVNVIVGLSPGLSQHIFKNTDNKINQHQPQNPIPLKRAAPTNLNAAFTLINQKEYEKAIALLNTIITNDPTDVMAYNYRGYAYLALKRYPQAFHDFTKVLELHPNDQDASKYLEYAKKMSNQ